MQDLKKIYHDLEGATYAKLREMVKSSMYTSEFVADAKALLVDNFTYKEICLVNDGLVFIDNEGYQYDLSCESLEYLIDLTDI